MDPPNINDISDYLGPRLFEKFSVEDIRSAVKRLQDELPVREVDQKVKECSTLFRDIMTALSDPRSLKLEMHAVLPDWHGHFGKFKVWVEEWNTLRSIDLEKSLSRSEGEISQVRSLGADLDDMLANLKHVQLAVHNALEIPDENFIASLRLRGEVQDIDDIIDGLFRRAKMHEKYLELRKQASGQFTPERALQMQPPVTESANLKLSGLTAFDHLSWTSQSELTSRYVFGGRQFDDRTVERRTPTRIARERYDKDAGIQHPGRPGEALPYYMRPYLDNIRLSLDKSFQQQVNPHEFFILGKVFKAVWTESTGTASAHNSLGSYRNSPSVNDWGENIFTMIRWFVVIREGEYECIGLPISTYSGRGVSKPGLKKNEHAIIYTGSVEPKPLPGEQPGIGELGMLPPIRMDMSERIPAPSIYSRVCFTRTYTIPHDIKVADLGMVNTQFMTAFLEQFRFAFFGNSKITTGS